MLYTIPCAARSADHSCCWIGYEGAGGCEGGCDLAWAIKQGDIHTTILTRKGREIGEKKGEIDEEEEGRREGEEEGSVEREVGEKEEEEEEQGNE
jgi:hypothetical protein